MPNTGGFDVMLQFKQDIINDILVRVLNESLITNLHLKSPLSRLIDEPVPPTQVKVWWDKPELELDDADSISLSVEVTGGARQLVTERTLSVDGSVSITRKALVATEEKGAPYLSLESPQPFDLHMSKLKVTYEGSKWPELLSRIDPTRETTVLRPLLTMALMLPLSQLPLSYNVESLPLHILAPNSSSTPSEWNIPVTTAMMRVLKQADAVAMGLSWTGTRCDHTQMTTAFPEEVKSNAALTLTSRGLNNIIGQLRRRGALEGVITSSSKEAPVNWQWEVLTIQCHQGYISLTGNFRRNAIPIRVIADLKCSLDRNRSLTITPLAINTHAPTTETIVSSLYEVLRMILRARAKNTRDDDSQEWGKLFQCFTIPGTPIEVEAPADDILIEEGTFTLLYDVPQTLKGFQAEVPSPEPQVTIIEPYIPMQTAPGAPVSMQMQAQLTTQSFPPYDYVWTTGPTGKPTNDRGPGMTITGSPTPAGPGPQVYTNVHVKVIDTFGQVAEASAPARYQAQARRQQRSSRGSGLGNADSTPVVYAAVAPPPQLQSQHRRPSRGWMKGVGCLGIIAIIAIIVISIFPYIPVGAHSPQLTVSPGSLNTSSCAHSNSGTWTCIVTVGESSSSQGNLTWSASSYVGASFNPTSGTLQPGQTAMVSISVPDTTCLASATFAFRGPANTVNVPWSCTPLAPPKLTESPSSLNFSTLNTGTSKVLSLKVGNSGGQPLTWNANTGGTSWLTLDKSTGTILPGDPQQTINVTANTANLSQGNYSATVNITSNGGNAQVAVSLVVAKATPTATLSVSTSTINGNIDCSYDVNNGWTCSVSVISDSSNQSSLDWSASSSGASFNPPNGTLSSPGQTTPVTVFVSAKTVCPTQIDLAFQGPANIVHVTWSCASPTLSVTPNSLNPGNCASSGNGHSCTVTLSDDQGGASWSASSGSIKDGVTFSPQSGTVYPGGVQVTIFVPGCNNSITFSFAGPGNTATASWGCIG